MRSILSITLLAVTLCMAYSQISYAVCTEGPPNTFTCNTNPPNPDTEGIQQDLNDNNITVNMLQGSAIDTTGDPGLNLPGIQTGDGAIDFTIDNAVVMAQDYCIENSSPSPGGQVTLKNAQLSSVDNNCISLNTNNNGPYILNISDSIVSTIDDTIIRTGGGDDIYNVINSEIKVSTASGNDLAITTSGGNDRVTLENTLLVGGTSNQPFVTAIRLGSDNDTLTIGNGVQMRGLLSGNEETNGLINCDEGFDTIIFAMDVPQDAVTFISTQILQAGLPDGNITINGLYYEWIGCELLVPELNGVRISRPIPTLSEWGLIAMAGLIGIIAFFAIRKRVAA